MVTTSKAQPMKELVKQTSLKLKTCPAKDNVKRRRRQATDQQKIFAKDKCGKGLLSKIYNEHLKLSSKKIT